MAKEKGEQQQPNIWDKIKIKFKKDFFKWALISIWATSIIFMLLLNLFVVFNVEGHYEGEGNFFPSYDLTKIYLEIVLSVIMMIAIISLLIKKRSFAEKLGIIVSSIVIYQAVFITIFYNIYSSVANATFDDLFIWNFFRHWLLGLIHLIAIFMILIDTKKRKKDKKSEENYEQETNKQTEKIEEKNNKAIKNKPEEIEKSKNAKKKKEELNEKESIFSRKDKKEADVENKSDGANSSLSSDDIDALDELNKIVVDEDKESEEEELKNLSKEKKDKNNEKD